MENMSILLKLQDIDLELGRIKAEHDAIPTRMAQFDNDVNEIKAEFEKRESELKSLKLAAREAEGKVALLEESSNRYKNQLLTVKTNREYSALLTEIESVKKEKEELEEQIIRSMELAENMSQERQAAKARLRELEKERDAQKSELEVRLRELAGVIAVSRKERGTLAANVDRTTLTLYERIMNSRINRAVVALRNGSCGGCFALVPLQKVADIRLTAQIYTCDSCGRILYYVENGNQ